MSAAGKTKRGDSGKKNAENSPFRLNGRIPHWQAQGIGAFHVPASYSSGRKTLMGLEGGVMVEKLFGFPWRGSEAKYDLMIEHAEARVTSNR